MSVVDAVVLAGSPAGAEMDPDGTVGARAMLDICGKTMIQRVVDGLRSSSTVGRIAAVGNVSADGLDIVVDPVGSLLENMRAAIEPLHTDKHVLVVTADIPLLTPEAVDDFVTRALKLNLDFVYPIVNRRVCEAKYPQFRRTYVNTADGTFTGGNLMFVRPRFVIENHEFISRTYTARKNVLKLAGLIGFGVLARLIVGQIVPSALPLYRIEQAASRMLGTEVRALISEHAEIGEDVDKPTDLAAVRKIFAAN